MRAEIPKETPMRFTLADLDLRWVGNDAATPAGCTLGHGYDPLGNLRLFLWRGDQPSDGTFLGSVLTKEKGPSTAYGPGGGYVGSGMPGDLLDRLANA
jgi:hypothetical protein